MSNKAINWAHSLKGKGGYKNVLIAMGDSANQYMATWPSRETLSKRTGLSEDTVKGHQAKAVANGDLILVPWQTEKGGDASPAYFLGCVRDLFPELPPLELAFAKRINFKGPGKGGRPRDYIPSWWSGEKLNGGHRCTCCGGVCNGSSEADATTIAETEDVAPEGVPEGVSEGYPEPLDLPLDDATSHPGEGGGFSTQEGGFSTTPPGADFHHPFNPQQGKPSVVTPQPRANAEAFARSSSVDSQAGLSLGGGSGGREETDAAMPDADPSGLPAGHDAKAASREREVHDNLIDAYMPPLRLVDDDYEPAPVTFDEQPPGLAAQWNAGRRAAAAVKNQKRSDDSNQPDPVHSAALLAVGDENFVRLTQDAVPLCPSYSMRAVYAKAYELGIERGLIKAAA